MRTYLLTDFQKDCIAQAYRHQDVTQEEIGRVFYCSRRTIQRALIEKGVLPASVPRKSKTVRPLWEEPVRSSTKHPAWTTLQDILDVWMLPPSPTEQIALPLVTL